MMNRDAVLHPAAAIHGGANSRCSVDGTVLSRNTAKALFYAE
jgi:hypothetical protein